MDVVCLDDDVAKIDPDPEHDPLFLGCPGVSLAHSTLHSDRTGDGLNDTWKFDQDAVAGRFDDAAFVLDDLRINEFLAMRSEPSQSASLVPADQPRVAGHIGSENGSEPALHALSAHSDASLGALRESGGLCMARCCSGWEIASASSLRPPNETAASSRVKVRLRVSSLNGPSTMSCWSMVGTGDVSLQD